jgi:hypothetical protein
MRIQRSDEYVAPTLLSVDVRLRDEIPRSNSAFRKKSDSTIYPIQQPAPKVKRSSPTRVKPEAN